MKIIIDGSIYSLAPSGGTFRYCNELIPRLSKFPNTQVTIFTPKNPIGIPSGPNISVTKDSLPSGSWLPEGRLKRFLRDKKQDLKKFLLKKEFSKPTDSVFHSPYYNSAPWSTIPQVVTVHDMISELFEETYDLPHVKALREVKTQALSKATRVIAISHQTKKDLHRIYQIPESKIDVIYHGVDYQFFSQAPAPEKVDPILKKLNLLSPYFLYVGGRLHHKNFKRFLCAFAQSPMARDFKLAVAGASWDDEEGNLIRKLDIEKQLVWMPNLNETDLSVAYQNALALALPSYYEGFGLPLIEAMAAGCPVIASNTGPFPELAGAAALFFDPSDEKQMANALEKVLEPQVRSSLIQSGKKQALKFSWDTSAEQHLESYKTAIETF